MFVWSIQVAQTFFLESLEGILRSDWILQEDTMCNTPVLALPDYSQEFVVETDASHAGIGVVLIQKGRLVAYFGKVLAMKHRGRVTSTIQQKGLIKLLGLDNEVKFKRGDENRVDDALSKQFEWVQEEEAISLLSKLKVISSPVPTWVKSITTIYEGDTLGSDLITQLVVDLQGPNMWHYQSGILRKKGKIYVGSTSTLRQQLLQVFHSSSLGGHSECDICQRSKDETIAYPGLLQPLSIPNQEGTQISMDFIEWLPKSQGKDVISVEVDRFTKSTHFIALSHPYTAMIVVDKFWKRVQTLHDTMVPAAEDVIMHRQQMQQLLKDNLHKARERMKYFPEQQRTEKEFQVGDMVYLKLQPYRQTSLALRKNLKLSSKYYGPYQVINRIGLVSYKLAFPPSSKVHLIFYVSLLKNKVGSRVVVQSTLPMTNGEGQFIVKLVTILQRQLVQRENSTVVKLLIQWFSLPPEDANGEDFDFIKVKFPEFIANP
ncbi:hypothetical protein KY284_001382 [Solanum tuberosum]|nr:hypothetical protein KY284_001382 [Solanum tuberosum]